MAERQKTSLILPVKLWRLVKVRAIREGRDAQEIVAEALEDYLRKVRAEKGKVT